MDPADETRYRRNVPIATGSPRPIVSVTIPAYNAAKTLADTLESVLAQDHPSFEVIVVDDGSRDETAAVALRYAPRVRLVQKTNGGLADARNAGIGAARGELIALLDADDLCAPDRLSTQARVLAQHPEVALCCSELSAFDERGTFSAAYSSTYYSAIEDTPGGIGAILATRGEVALPSGTTAATYRGDGYDTLVRGNFVHPPTVMFRREIFDRAGPFDTSFRWTSDWEWFIRAARCGPIAFVDRPLLEYRISSSQMSGGANRLGASLEFLAVLDKTCRADPGLLVRSRRDVRRQLRAFCIEAAYNHAESAPRVALQLLLRSARYGRPTTDVVKIAAKAMLPSFLLARASRWRRTRRPTEDGSAT